MSLGFPVSSPVLLFCVTEGQVLPLLHEYEPQTLAVASKCHCSPTKCRGTIVAAFWQAIPAMQLQQPSQFKLFMFQRQFRHCKCPFIPNWKRAPLFWNIQLNGCAKTLHFRSTKMILDIFSLTFFFGCLYKLVWTDMLCEMTMQYII